MIIQEATSVGKSIQN